MSDSMASLRRQIDSAADLQSVVRTMRALAASGIGQYERAVAALVRYDRAIALGLGVCLRAQTSFASVASADRSIREAMAIAVVFGSDQGLVGQFNDVVVDHAIEALSGAAHKPLAWVVGERAAARLVDAGIEVVRVYPVPSTVDAIDMLVGQLQVDIETHPSQSAQPPLFVFHNRPLPGALYEPGERRLLPLDAQWLSDATRVPWPTSNPPEIIGEPAAMLRTLIREYLFISLYRACAESLASENASRLAAMQRADKSIDDTLETLHGTFDRLRQGAIDAELFDVTAGYESLASPSRKAT